ncbi:MAG TPA: glycosyltransferase family 4 protein [Pirellulales bacterium]|jgi:glycosyltransferase involved in cell wall biosynthesis|nr:glycosyltransferase family 4 protein [Pirellulales bacterium]
MTLPKRVLHVLNSAGGGAAMSTIALARALAEQGITSAAVCHDVGAPEEREALKQAMPGGILFARLYWWNRKTRMPLWRRPLAEFKQVLMTGWSRGSAARVADFARDTRADLIHTNTILTPEGGLAARALHLPHVWHVRELLGPNNPFRLAREGAAFGQYMQEHCSKLVANSHASAAAIRSWVPDDLLEVVPNGIDCARFEPRGSRAKPGRVVVAMVGNVTSRSKKHALFIEAAARADRDLPIEWRIYGHLPAEGDAYLGDLRARVARAGLNERVTFAGFVADPVDIMREVDLVVHPADNESFGRVVVEAMAAALPVVGVAGGGVAEIIQHGETGLLAEPDDPASLASCIEQIARDESLARTFGAAGRQRAMDTYSLAANVKGILRVYEEAMQKPVGMQTAALATVAH